MRDVRNLTELGEKNNWHALVISENSWVGTLKETKWQNSVGKVKKVKFSSLKQCSIRH